MLTDFAAVEGAYNDDRTSWVFPVIESQSSKGGHMKWWMEVRMFLGTEEMCTELAIDYDPDPKSFLKILPEWHANERIGKRKGIPIYSWMRTYVTYNDGPTRKAFPTIITIGKNIGRANETNVFCQALRQAHNLHEKQCRKSSDRTASGDDFAHRIHPALARPTKDASSMRQLQKYYDAIAEGQSNEELAKILGISYRSDGCKKPTKPGTVFVQPKLDGNRAVSCWDYDAQTVHLYTRDRKLYTRCAWIMRALEKLYSTIILDSDDDDTPDQTRAVYLDGEIYQPGKTLQKINSFRSEKEEERSPDNFVRFHIFDYFVVDQTDGSIVTCTTSSRLHRLESLERKIRNLSNAEDRITIEGGIEFVQAIELRCPSMSRIDNLYNAYVKCGNEGMIVRLEGPYVPSPKSYRSPYLWKYKPRMDGEYEIVAYNEGKKGKAKGLLMITCKTDGGKEFTVTPKLTEKCRRKMYSDFSEIVQKGVTVFDKFWLGTRITVAYDDISNDGIPLRASTNMIIREDYAGEK